MSTGKRQSQCYISLQHTIVSWPTLWSAMASLSGNERGAVLNVIAVWDTERDQTVWDTNGGPYSMSLLSGTQSGPPGCLRHERGAVLNVIAVWDTERDQTVWDMNGGPYSVIGTRLSGTQSGTRLSGT